MSEQPNSAPGADPLRPSVPASQRTWGDSMSQLDMYAERARVAMPAAPPGLMDGYMRFAPWVAIIFGVLGLILLLGVLIIGAVVTPIAIALGVTPLSYGAGAFLSLIAGIISAALEIVGGYLMLQRKETGWWLLAVGIALTILGNLLRVNLLVLLLALAIGYVHLQVKPNYH
jgi:hypothetical protein